MLLQHCLQIGSFSPLKKMYSFMFSLQHLFFHGFLQCSNLQPSDTASDVTKTAFKALAETALQFFGEVS
jgi:hypothetical protein